LTTGIASAIRSTVNTCPSAICPPSLRTMNMSSLPTAHGFTKGRTAMSGFLEPIIPIGGPIIMAAGSGIRSAAGPGFRPRPGAGVCIITAAGIGDWGWGGIGFPTVIGVQLGFTGIGATIISAGVRSAGTTALSSSSTIIFMIATIGRIIPLPLGP
jgi:hypothetical protein